MTTISIETVKLPLILLVLGRPLLSRFCILFYNLRLLEVSNTLDFSKFSSINLKKYDSICDAFLFSLFNENERKNTGTKKKKS